MNTDLRQLLLPSFSFLLGTALYKTQSSVYKGGGISKAMNRVEMVPSKTSAATMMVMRKKVDVRERVLRR